MTKDDKKELDESSKYENKSVQKAIKIFQLFSEKKQKVTATEIANELDTQPGTIYPILYVLEENGYLKKDKGKEYRLDYKFLEHANLVLKGMEVEQKAKPHLRKLADKLKANSHLGVLRNRKVLYLDREVGAGTVAIREITGLRETPHCTAMGKVLLSDLEEERLEEIIKQEGLRPITNNTITDKETFFSEIEEVRKEGYAINNEESQEGIVGVGAPVKDYRGNIHAAIAASVMKSRFNREKDDLVAEVLQAGKNISYEMGYKDKSSVS